MNDNNDSSVLLVVLGFFFVIFLIWGNFMLLTCVPYGLSALVVIIAVVVDAVLAIILSVKIINRIKESVLNGKRKQCSDQVTAVLSMLSQEETRNKHIRKELSKFRYQKNNKIPGLISSLSDSSDVKSFIDKYNSIEDAYFTYERDTVNSILKFKNQPLPMSRAEMNSYLAELDNSLLKQAALIKRVKQGGLPASDFYELYQKTSEYKQAGKIVKRRLITLVILLFVVLAAALGYLYFPDLWTWL